MYLICSIHAASFKSWSNHYVLAIYILTLFISVSVAAKPRPDTRSIGHRLRSSNRLPFHRVDGLSSSLRAVSQPSKDQSILRIAGTYIYSKNVLFSNFCSEDKSI